MFPPANKVNKGWALLNIGKPGIACLIRPREELNIHINVWNILLLFYCATDSGTQPFVSLILWMPIFRWEIISRATDMFSRKENGHGSTILLASNTRVCVNLTASQIATSAFRHIWTTKPECQIYTTPLQAINLIWTSRTWVPKLVFPWTKPQPGKIHQHQQLLLIQAHDPRQELESSLPGTKSNRWRQFSQDVGSSNHSAKMKTKLMKKQKISESEQTCIILIFEKAVTCSHLLMQPLAATCPNCHPASGCKWLQVAASGCVFENQIAHLLRPQCKVS